MNDLNFGSRLGLALTLPFKVLFDGALAARIIFAQQNKALPAPLPQDTESADAKAEATEPTSQATIAAIDAEVPPTAALQLLSILQREGRFIDFLQEEMSGFSDADIGAAARVVQEGCKRGLAQYVQISAIRSEAEGTLVTLAPGYNAQQNRLSGNVTGEPPYRGSLAHHGWRVEHIELPKLAESYDPSVLAPAEIEI